MRATIVRGRSKCHIINPRVTACLLPALFALYAFFPPVVAKAELVLLDNAQDPAITGPGITASWTDATITPMITVPTNSVRGPFNPEVTLNIGGLPNVNKDVRVSFSLYTLGSWDGTGNHGEEFATSIDGVTVFRHTFCVWDNEQSFLPATNSQNYPVENSACRTGSVGKDVTGLLIWTAPPPGGVIDAQYFVSVSLPNHVGSTASIRFFTVGLEGPFNEAFAIDDLEVRIDSSSLLACNGAISECLFRVNEVATTFNDLQDPTKHFGCLQEQYFSNAESSSFPACTSINGGENVDNNSNAYFEQGFVFPLQLTFHATAAIPHYLYGTIGGIDTPYSGPGLLRAVVQTPRLAFRYTPPLGLPIEPTLLFEVRRAGSERNTLTNGTTSSTCYGIGENQFTVCSLPVAPPQAITDYAIYSVPNTGANNGNFINAAHLVNPNVSGATFASFRPKPSSFDVADPAHARLGQILVEFGEDDRTNHFFDINKIYDEFTVIGHHQLYEAASIVSAGEKQTSLNIPAALSVMETAGVSSTAKLRLTLNLNSRFSALTAYFSYLGEGNFITRWNGVELATDYSNYGSTRHSAAITLAPVEQGTNILELETFGSTSNIIDWLAIIDNSKSDWDADGLADKAEVQLGTGGANPDSDGDSILDGREVLEGSNPMDRGSARQVVRDRMCLPWNGFLGMWNVIECRNRGNEEVLVMFTLFDSLGAPMDSNTFSIKAYGQFDLLVHDIEGFTQNAIGSVCLQQLNATSGDLEGRMVYYRPNHGAQGAFDFVLALEAHQRPAELEQIVPINTFDPQNRGNFQANWLELTWVKVEDEVKGDITGKVLIADQLGAFIKVIPFSLRHGQRIDIAGHDIGPNRVATARVLIEQLIGNEAAKLSDQQISFRNNRYYFNGAVSATEFLSAVQLPGQLGTGQELFVSLNTAQTMSVVELTNASRHTNSLFVDFFHADGALIHTTAVTLNPHATEHVIANNIPGLAQTQGSARIRSTNAHGLVATAMHYGFSSAGILQNVYASQAREAYSRTLYSSYNTFLDQGCLLNLLNTGNSTANVDVETFDASGGPSLSRRTVMLSAYASNDIDLCNGLGKDRYGVIKLSPSRPFAIMANLLRLGKDRRYVLPLAFH